MSEEEPPSQVYGVVGGIGPYERRQVCAQGEDTFKVPLQTFHEFFSSPFILDYLMAPEGNS